jgi:hypothetical protein
MSSCQLKKKSAAAAAAGIHYESSEECCAVWEHCFVEPCWWSLTVQPLSGILISNHKLLWLYLFVTVCFYRSGVCAARFRQRLLRLHFLVSVIPIATWAVARRGCVVEGLVNRRVRSISCCVYSDISLVADFNVYPYIIRLNSEVNIQGFSNGISDMEKCDYFTAAFLCLISIIRPWTTYILSTY